jgi:tetratricopeptide (TPR) repeat protein
VGLAAAVLLVPPSSIALADLTDDLRRCREGHGPPAVEACSRAVAAPELRGEDRALVYFNRAIALSEAGKPRDAIADLTRAIELSPADHRALNERGRAHRSLGEYDAAIADFTAAHRLKPDHARYLGNRGLAYKLKGDQRRALADYDAALRINPDDDAILHNRGTLHRELKDYPGGVRDLERALRFDPGDASTMVQLGRVYAEQARHADAVRYYDPAIERRPKDGLAWLLRGLSHLALGRADLALRDLKKAEELGVRDPRLTSALDSAGRLASRQEPLGPPSRGRGGPRAVTGEASPGAPEPAAIRGSVSAGRAGAVQVSFEAHPEAAPRAGDRVDFSTEIDGIRVDAGQGEVSEVEATSVWVRVSRGRPDLGHNAVILATGQAKRPGSSPQQARPLGSREAAAGPKYIDLPANLGALPFEPNPPWPDVIARGGRRLRRPAGGWRQVDGSGAWRMVWRTEEGPFSEGPHYRLPAAAVYGSSSDSGFVTVSILWYPPGSGGGRCPPVHRNSKTGRTGIISDRADVRAIFSPSAFMFASGSQPGLSALQAFARQIFAQLEPFANPCRP